MLLRRLDAPTSVLRIRSEMDRLLNDMWDTVARGTAQLPFGHRAFPALNVWEDDENLYAEAELPGFTMNDLELYVSGAELTIKGGRKSEPAENVTYHRRERGVGVFGRVLRLPVDIDADKVEASLRNGVLSITLPKAAAVRPRRIEVKS